MKNNNNIHNPQNLLVTGGAGFIGTNFVNYWIKQYPDTNIIVLDALTYAGNHTNLDSLSGKSGYRFIHGDILDQKLTEKILRENTIDTIVHFAAESHVDRSIHGPDAFLQTNIIGTHSLLKAAKSVWLDTDSPLKHRFHHVSTDEVYGSLKPDDPAFSETTPYAPNSPYAASKASSDHIVRAYHETYGLNVTTSNCSNNYGPYQFPEKLIPLIITNILCGKTLPVYGDGLQIRDWLYVDDHNRGVDLVIHKGHANETYNIGGHNEWTNLEIVRLVCNLIDDKFSNETSLPQRFPHAPQIKNNRSDSLIRFVSDRPGHDRRYAINALKITRELEYEPVESFESGIKKTIDWYLHNEKWWRDVMDGSYQDWINRHYRTGQE